MTRSQCEKEFLTGLTKIRWNRMGKTKEKIKLSRPLEDVLEDEEAEKEVFLAKRVFNTDTGKVDLGFVRSTNMKTSRRVTFPPGRPIKEEAVLEVRKELWTSLTNKYIEEKCDKLGNQTSDQLSKSQMRGRTKLLDRVRKSEIHVSSSDKGNGVVLMPMSMYSNLVKVHTDKDIEVTWEDLETAQKEIRSHSRSLAKITGLGSNEGENNIDRCHQNVSSWACDPPILKVWPRPTRPQTQKATQNQGR